jgi:pimeloyl-ACP methyl ester carboxylesterase
VKQVVVLLPGIMGSVLKLGEQLVWPGPVTTLLLPYEMMQELTREDLVATDCIREFFVTDQYQKLIEDLELCGFNEADKTLVVAAYDWRKDNAHSAETLARVLAKVQADSGADTEVTLVAHSMGGLVARYYLESGDFSTREGFARVRRLITLGTPHDGAALALPLVLGFEKRLFLSKDQVLQVCSDPRYPAAYQLLPPVSEPFAWDGHVNSRFEPTDIYDPHVAAQLGLIRQNVDAARRFHQRLDWQARPADVRYFCFAGTRQTTATHVLLRPGPDGRVQPAKVEQDDGGDGTVPTWSSFIHGAQRMFVGGDHGTIYANRELRRTLATLLGKEGVLAGVPDQVEVAIRDKVVEPSDLVHVTISFPTALEDFSGVLTIERALLEPATGAVTGFAPPEAVRPVEYKGLGLETVSLVLEAPAIRGAYRVGFRNEPAGPLAGFDELVVQEPPG